MSDYFQHGKSGFHIETLKGMSKEEARKAFGKKVKNFDEFWKQFKQKHPGRAVNKAAKKGAK